MVGHSVADLLSGWAHAATCGIENHQISRTIARYALEAPLPWCLPVAHLALDERNLVIGFRAETGVSPLLSDWLDLARGLAAVEVLAFHSYQLMFHVDQSTYVTTTVLASSLQPGWNLIAWTDKDGVKRSGFVQG